MFRTPTLPPPRGTLSWLLQLAYTTARLFKQNSLQNHAAATSFYFLLSATPPKAPSPDTKAAPAGTARKPQGH
ncbi:MAG: hypothetical protein ACLGH1_11475, partial [Gammaproteobacteria bacterium]